MRMQRRGGGSAAAIAILLIGLSGALGWLAISPGVWGGDGGSVLEGPLATNEVVEPAPAALIEGIRVQGAFQVSQPRDPFRPLISPDAVTGVDGVDSGNGDGFTPTGTRVKLVEIRDVGGVLRATVEVDGTSFDVGVGDTFAGSFLVVSLDEDSGVFLFGDNAFELSVGQEILK